MTVQPRRCVAATGPTRGVRQRAAVLLLLALPVVFGLTSGTTTAAADSALGDCLVLDIRHSGAAGLARLRAVAGLETWLELDRELFACGPPETRSELARLAPVARDLGALRRDRLRLALGLHPLELEALGVRALAMGGRFAVVEIGPDVDRTVTPRLLLPFVTDQVLARASSNEPFRARTAIAGDRVRAMVAEVDGPRWFDDVTRLAGYNRYTSGNQINAARRWLVQQFEAMPGVEVESRAIELLGGGAANVVATLRGRSRPDEWYVVGGHYDSISESPWTAAPGAEDNASGCAGVLEIARIFTANPPAATVVFICYAGEEQGLFGSLDHAAELVDGGDAPKVRGVLSLDMIGYTADRELGAILESDPNGQPLVEALAAAAETFTSLRVVTSIHPFVSLCCSDHVPYGQRGMPALLAIEDDWNRYPHYHRTTDLPEHLSLQQGRQILRMVVGALAGVAATAELLGCVEVDGGPLPGARAIVAQPGEPRSRTSTDGGGCVAYNGLTAGKGFRVRVDGPRLAADARAVSVCARLRGRPLSDRRVELRQPGEPRQSARTDADGCAAFEPKPGATFRLTLRGPKVLG